MKTEDICPICGLEFPSCEHVYKDYIREVYRLRKKLKKARKQLKEAQLAAAYAIVKSETDWIE
jgi:hypothetical protein